MSKWYTLAGPNSLRHPTQIWRRDREQIIYREVSAGHEQKALLSPTDFDRFTADGTLVAVDEDAYTGVTV